MPEGIDSGDVIKFARDTYGVIMANGQGGMKGKILRLAHMGYCSAMDLLAGLAALEQGLKAAGHDVKLGASLAAAQEIFAQSPKDVLR